MIKDLFFIINLFFVLLIYSSCNKNLEAEIPSYIEIEEFNYLNNDSSVIPHTDGYDNYQSTNISDVWVSMNGQTIGVFEMPCTIPILSDGNHSFDLYPGIKVNGISGSREKYIFYEKYTTVANLNKAVTQSIIPVTTYKKETNYKFLEQGQFEIDGTMLEKSGLSDTIAIIQEDEVFQGKKSAAIYLDTPNTYFDIRTIENLQNLTENTFLELNFKSNISFNIGLVIVNSIEQKQELIQIYPTNVWKKIYLDLTPIISMGNSLSTYKIYIDGYYDNNQPINAVFIDNLKLVF